MRSYYDNGTLMLDGQTFVCQACLDDKPLSEVSIRDACYCAFCQAIIAEEYRAASERAGRASQYEPMPLQKAKAIQETGTPDRPNRAVPQSWHLQQGDCY